jgi:hypothetical protein
MPLHGGYGPMRLIDLADVLPDPWKTAREQEERERRENAWRSQTLPGNWDDDDEDPVLEAPAPQASGEANRLHSGPVCGSCSTAEVVPWFGQNPDCGHPECADALARCAAPHRLDGRRFHGQVNIIMIEPHLWDRYDKAS